MTILALAAPTLALLLPVLALLLPPRLSASASKIEVSK
jgi:hypothetical protein